MLQWLYSLNKSSLIPHGYCLQWNPQLLWTLAISDTIITLTYFSIPFAIWYFAKRRQDIPHRWLFVLFALFIVACGLTHLMDVLNIWRPDYWLSAATRVVTAALSLATAIVLWLVMPKALSAPSAQQLEHARQELLRVNSELESRVNERTRELNAALLLSNQTMNDLQRSHALLSTVINTSPVRVFWKSRDLHYLGGNIATARDAGLAKAEELVGKTDFDLSWKDHADRYRADDTIVIESGIAKIGYEEPQTSPSGKTIWLQTSKVPLKDPSSNEIIGVLGTYEDITARKQQEMQTKQYEAIVTSSDDAILSKSLDGKITSWNPGAERIFGYTAEEMIGQTIRVLLPDDKHDEEDRILERIARGETIEHFETRRKCKDGRLIDVSVTISPILDMQGKVIGASKIARDITQEKTQEMELDLYRKDLENLVKIRTMELEKAKQEAESANHSKSTFLANMSHEIRTPLNAIIGLAHLLHEQTTQIEMLSKIDKIIWSGKHLLHIIGDVLDLSKIEADSLTLEEITFLVPQVTDYVHSALGDRIASKGLNWQVEIDPNLKSLALYGDPQRLRQIMINYVSNAIKFTEQGGITLRAKLQSLDENAHLLFEVEDTGIGLSQKEQALLFQPFVQADSSISRKYGGTGLGLVISNRLAKMMGGETGVNSTPGIGSTFWFTAVLKLSTADQLAQQSGELGDTNRVRRGAHVLLVEDNEINQEVAREMLQGLGLQVDIANHGAEALDLTQHTTYDVILMDMQMPVMDGLETTQIMRQLPDFKDTPIIAMTANAFKEDRIKCQQAGMNDFLAKPVEPERLLQVLSKWIPETESFDASIHQTMNKGHIEISADQLCQMLGTIDVKQGLRYFSDKLTSYRSMLLKYSKLHRDEAAKIRHALEQNHPEAAQRLAHSLKSTSATLGAEQVRQIAYDIECMIRDGSIDKPLDHYLSLLEQALHAVCDDIEQLHVYDSAKYEDDIDPANVKHLIVSLETKLAIDSWDVIPTWTELQPILKKILSSHQFSSLQSAIESFDLPNAHEQLKQIIAEHPALKSS